MTFTDIIWIIVVGIVWGGIAEFVVKKFRKKKTN
jgi:uncharacterized membrane protein YeaQ/YmgE (transglycosylase-associated protein family)